MKDFTEFAITLHKQNAAVQNLTNLVSAMTVPIVESAPEQALEVIQLLTDLLAKTQKDMVDLYEEAMGLYDRLD